MKWGKGENLGRAILNFLFLSSFQSQLRFLIMRVKMKVCRPCYAQQDSFKLPNLSTVSWMSASASNRSDFESSQRIESKVEKDGHDRHGSQAGRPGEEAAWRPKGEGSNRGENGEVWQVEGRGWRVWSYFTNVIVNREIQNLESSKQVDDLTTAQLEKLVDNLESSLESYKSVDQHSIYTSHRRNVF